MFPILVAEMATLATSAGIYRTQQRPGAVVTNQRPAPGPWEGSP